MSFSDCRRRVASKRVHAGYELRFHKQIGKRRVGLVGGLRCNCDLDIRSDLNFAGAGSQVGNRNATHLGIVFGRNNHFQRGGQGAVTPNEFGAIFAKGNFVGVGFDAAGLVPRRPNMATSAHREERCRSPSSPG